MALTSKKTDDMTASLRSVCGRGSKGSVRNFHSHLKRVVDDLMNVLNTGYPFFEKRIPV
jgi:hypothetical protein